MIAQHPGGNLCTRLRGYIRDEYGGFAEGVEKPFSQCAFGVHEVIVGPKSELPRGGVFRGTKERTVRWIGEHGVDFGLRIGDIGAFVLFLCQQSFALSRSQRIPMLSAQFVERRCGVSSSFHGTFHGIDCVGNRGDHAGTVSSGGVALLGERRVEGIVDIADTRVELFACGYFLGERTTHRE